MNNEKNRMTKKEQIRIGLLAVLGPLVLAGALLYVIAAAGASTLDAICRLRVAEYDPPYGHISCPEDRPHLLIDGNVMIDCSADGPYNEVILSAEQMREWN